MARESKAAKRERALVVQERMHALFPDAACALVYDGDPFRLVIATLLSAQTTDKGVNKVTPALWQRYPTVQDLAAASPADIEEIIRTIGFYRTKAANCVKCAQVLLDKFDGEVPRTIPELITLPGVGRKTANVVLAEAFNIAQGIAVDTHVFRIAHQLRLSSGSTPEAVEADLTALYPQDMWTSVNRYWVLFGREVCVARRPHCDTCPLSDICPSFVQ